MLELRAVASRFPLAPRPRPAGARLADRITGLLDTAHDAANSTGDDALAAAARVHNQAALIASDAGLPELARSLCWQHAELYHSAFPVEARTARLALEPIVNLARLLIRSGRGAAAWTLLCSLSQAAGSAAALEVEGRHLPVDRIVATEADRRELARWLWTVRLADGLRALAVAGQWDRAAEQARKAGGVGQRLFDGRQAVILAELTSGHHQDALETVNGSSVSDSWEAAVQACLGLLCRLGGGMPVESVPAETVQLWQRLPEQPGLIMFRTRVGITAWELADTADHSAADRVPGEVAEQVLRAADGYAARELLNAARNRLSPTQITALESVQHDSGLDTGMIPNPLREQLNSALNISGQVISRLLAR